MVNSILSAIFKRFSLAEVSEKIGVVLMDWLSVFAQLPAMKTLYSTEAGRFYSENNTNKIKYNNNGEKVHLSVLEDTTSGKRYLQVARKLSWLEKLLNKINAAIQGFIDNIKASIHGFFKNLLSKVPFWRTNSFSYYDYNFYNSCIYNTSNGCKVFYESTKPCKKFI